MPEIKDLAIVVTQLAKPKMSPKELRAAVRKLHPKASKKEITRAAFYAVILAAEASPDTAQGLHTLAIESRNDVSNEE